MTRDELLSAFAEPIPVLDDGHVLLVDVMGDEQAIVDAARVSYGTGTRRVSEDRALLRYLMRHRHTTPFEMVEMKFRVRVPMDCWRQWIRHRTASVNEYSTRYSEAIDSRQTTHPTSWRAQAASNKQGSAGFVAVWPDGFDRSDARLLDSIDATPGDYLTDRERLLHEYADRVYKERLDFGVAREQARKDLPLSTYTEAYWKCDLHNLLHFLALRLDAHAQLEIRQYAQAIASIVKEWVPTVWDAFEDYRLNAVTLSGSEALALQRFIAGESFSLDALSSREQVEFKSRFGLGGGR